mgnify:CR=1 FL=1|jgi:hypothetical protein
MANIIVAGDSWSTSQLTSNANDIFEGCAYPAQLSVANRLRSSGHFVHEAARGGDSMLRQLDILEELFNSPSKRMYESVDYVLLSWTEWYRDTELGISVANGGPVESVPAISSDFLQERTQVLDQVEARFLEFSSQWPSVPFLHWGGQAPVSIDMTKLGAQHHVLYKDYALEEWDAAPNNSHLYGAAPRNVSIRECTKWAQRVFPGTSKELANTIAVEIHQRYRSLLTLDHFYDGGHINFHCYAPLITLVNAHIDPEEHVTAKTYSDFAWPK